MASKKAKKKSPATRRPKRNAAKVVRAWGGEDLPVSAEDGNKVARGKRTPRVRNPAPPVEESEEGQRARELTLIAWEYLYAKRGRGKRAKG